MNKLDAHIGKSGAAQRSPHRTDGSKFFTPAQTAGRWGWHTESVRRMLRDRRMTSVIVGRRRLIPMSEIERVEADGLIARAG